LAIAPCRHVVDSRLLLLFRRTKRRGIDTALRAVRLPEYRSGRGQRDNGGELFNEASSLFSGVEAINAAQPLYGGSTRIVWNQCVTAPASTTKIAITKFCGRVLIGRTSNALSRVSPEPMTAQFRRGISP
jgi:hypothetical protein